MPQSQIDLVALRRHGWLLLRSQPPQALAAAADALARSAPTAWPQPIGRPTLVRAQAGSPYATLRAGPAAFHSDGLHLNQPPRHLLLWCERPARHGGQTLLVRSRDVLEGMDATLQQRFRQTPVRVCTGDYRALRTLLAPHPDEGDETFCFFDPALADDGALEHADGSPASALIDAARAVIAQAPAWRHDWQPGDLLVVDNLRMLHARADYDDGPGEAPRQLHRCVVGPWAGARA